MNNNHKIQYCMVTIVIRGLNMWLKCGFMIVLKDFSRKRPQVARWGEVTLFHPTSTTPIPVQGLSLSNPFSWVLFLQNWEGFCTNGNYWGFSSSSSLTRSLALSISLCLAVTWFLCYSCWWRTVMAYCVWDTMAILKQQILKKMGRGGGWWWQKQFSPIVVF